MVLRLTHALALAAQEAASGESVRGEQRSGAEQGRRESRLGVSDYLRTATYVGAAAC